MSGVKHAPAKLSFDERIAVALVPSLLVLSGFGGRIAVGVGLVKMKSCFSFESFLVNILLRFSKCNSKTQCHADFHQITEIAKMYGSSVLGPLIAHI